MIEIEEMSERHLPPELIRRLQVEELWARRPVLAEWMNAERLRNFYQHRAELRPAVFPAVDVTFKELTIRPAASIVPLNAIRSA